jgi:hypothetical protein
LNERTKLVKVKVHDSNTVTLPFSIPFDISECLNERTKLVKVRVDDSNTVTLPFSIPFDIRECMKSKAESIIQSPSKRK